MPLQLCHHHRRAVNYSIGLSTLRGHPKGTMWTVIDYLCTLDLKGWGRFPENHQVQLDEHTLRLQARIWMNVVFQDQAQAVLQTHGLEQGSKRAEPLNQKEPRLREIISDAEPEISLQTDAEYQKCKEATTGKKRLIEMFVRQTTALSNKRLLDNLTRICSANNSLRYWGSARKSLNLFWATACYHRFLWAYLGLSALEDHLEVPLDDQVARKIKENANSSQLEWPGVQRLSSRISSNYQALALSLCNTPEYLCKRYELDFYFWRPDDDEA